MGPAPDRFWGIIYPPSGRVRSPLLPGAGPANAAVIGTLPNDETQILPLLEALPQSLVVIDQSGKFSYASPGDVHLPGADLREMIAGIHLEDRAKVQALVGKCLAGPGVYRERFRTPAKDGDWNWHDCTATSVEGENETRVAALLCHNVTALVLEEETLREDEERYRELAENATDLIIEVDASGRILYISPNSTKLTGRSPKEIIGAEISEFESLFSSYGPLSSDGGFGILEALQQTLALGETGNFLRYEYSHPDGTKHWFEMRAQSFSRSDGSIRVVVISRDVTDRIRAEQELLESEERYRIISEVTQDVISEMTESGELAYVSPTCEDVMGYSPEALLGTSPLGLVHPDDVQIVQDLIASTISGGKRFAIFPPYRIRHADGNWRWFEGAGISYEKGDSEYRLVAVSRDITERREQEEKQQGLEDQIRQAQKLEGLGVMAGGIAHDFNNFLTPILGEAGLALAGLPPDSPFRPRLEKVQAAARRAALLTSQMLAYAGKKTLTVAPIHLSSLVEEMAALMSSGISKKIFVEKDLPRDLPLIEGDSAQLTQVVMNLITNASEAVGDEEGGISIRTGIVHSSELDSRRLIGAESELELGDYVFIAVRDTGTGISPATQARIFDPFFTTKFAGRGLGLAAVLGIVRSHHGAIEIDSGPARGTLFRVVFPVSDSNLEAPPKPHPEPTEAWRGQGTVLIIDDDAGVVDLASETLRRCGIDSLTAADGRAGLQVFEENAERIDAVLLDRTMPGMSGEEVVAEMRKIRTDARIILVSGYSEERASLHFRESDLTAFLQKPFLPEKLVEIIRKAIGD